MPGYVAAATVSDAVLNVAVASEAETEPLYSDEEDVWLVAPYQNSEASDAESDSSYISSDSSGSGPPLRRGEAYVYPGGIHDEDIYEFGQFSYEKADEESEAEEAEASGSGDREFDETTGIVTATYCGPCHLTPMKTVAVPPACWLVLAVAVWCALVVGVFRYS